MFFIIPSGFGKWIGLFIGMIKGGPRGALLGFLVGCFVDSIFKTRATFNYSSHFEYDRTERPTPASDSLADAYRELGVEPSATDDEVRQAYRHMALLYHPDRMASLDEATRRTAERKFQQLNNAKDRIYKARGMK